MTSWCTARPRRPAAGRSCRGRYALASSRWRPGWPRSWGRVDDFGLIHADLHLGNALFHRGGVKLIDFDDSGTGPRLYELAVALWELRDGPDYPAYRDALLEGYRPQRDVDVTHLDDFIAVRQIAFALWYTGMAQVNPAFAARLDRVHRWSLSMLDHVSPVST